jgi:class 3 adenylate cyclase
VQRSWSWKLDSPPEALWPLLADTARFNEAAGFPRYTLAETPQPDGSVRRVARARLKGLPIAWEERPFEWVAGRWFRQSRRPLGGPIALFTATLTLAPDGAGSLVTYGIAMEPRNALGRLLLRLGIIDVAGRKVERLIRAAGEFAAGQRGQPFEFEPPRLPAGARQRADAAVLALEAAGHGMARRLAEHLLAAPETDLVRIRPRTLATAWDAPSRAVVELCLDAVKAGLLAMRWDLLCPRCRGAKLTAGSLDQIPRGAHCPSCNIEYGRDFAKNLEVTFRPAATIRGVAPGGFCLASPLATSHVLVQQILAPGEARTIEADLPPGAYRVRTLEPGGEVAVEHAGGPFPGIVVDGAAVTAGPAGPGPTGPGRLALRNDGAAERTVVIERRQWEKDALTAHEATTLQSFRDLFAAESLRPGDDVEIEQVTLMFTDLKGSTALYGRIGDARAYGIVREHYALLGAAIRASDGAIVKTIGDAVMAAFAEPAAAVRAALAVQRGIAAFNAGSEAGPVIVKLGLHCGPCIAVTLNDRLDYFGSTVNLAARLQGQSHGGDVVMSEPLAADPTVAPLLAGLPLVAETAEMKGFPEAVRFRRLTAAALRGRAAAE